MSLKQIEYMCYNCAKWTPGHSQRPFRMLVKRMLAGWLVWKGLRCGKLILANVLTWVVRKRTSGSFCSQSAEAVFHLPSALTLSLSVCVSHVKIYCFCKHSKNCPVDRNDMYLKKKFYILSVSVVLKYKDVPKPTSKRRGLSSYF